MPNHLEFFGLSQSPFEQKTLRPLVLETGPLRRAISFVRFELDSGTPVAVVSGASGVGKTSVALALPHVLQDRVALVLDPTEQWDALQTSIAEQLELEGGVFSAEALATARAEQARRLVLVIDDVGKLCDEALGQIEAMLGLSADDGTPLLSVVAIMDLEASIPGSSDHGARLILRTCPRIELATMLARELEQYVEARLSNAGWSGSLLFSREALHAVQALSDGNPRVANTLCERSLIAAARRGVVHIDEQLVTAAGRDGLAKAAPAGPSEDRERTADAKVEPAPAGPSPVPEETTPASSGAPPPSSAAEPSPAPEAVLAEPRFARVQAWSTGLAQRAAMLWKPELKRSFVLPAIGVIGIVLLAGIVVNHIHVGTAGPRVTDSAAMEGQESVSDAAALPVAPLEAEPAAIASSPATLPWQAEEMGGEEIRVDGAGVFDPAASPVPVVQVAEPVIGDPIISDPIIGDPVIADPVIGDPEPAPSSETIANSRTVPVADPMNSPDPATEALADATQADATQEVAPEAAEPDPVPAAPAHAVIPWAADPVPSVALDLGNAPGSMPSLELPQPELNKGLRSRRQTNGEPELRLDVEDATD